MNAKEPEGKPKDVSGQGQRQYVLDEQPPALLIAVEIPGSTLVWILSFIMK
jgi:hypothetical protein